MGGLSHPHSSGIPPTPRHTPTAWLRLQGRRPILTLADRLLATILHHRLALPQVAIAELFGVRPETINRRMRETRQLLDQAGHTVQPGPRRLATLDDLHRLATVEEIARPKSKPAS